MAKVSDLDTSTLIDYLKKIKELRSVGNFIEADKIRSMLLKQHIGVREEKPDVVVVEYYKPKLLCNGVMSPEFNIERV